MPDSPSTRSAAAPTGPPAPPPRGLHERVLDQLGMSICQGELAPGDVLYIDDLVGRYAVSRSVVREALRVLASMGLVASRRRVGTQILAASEWNVFDPTVIRWRLASSDRIGQLRSITELRSAVEPQAAYLAASRAALHHASDLVGVAARMWAAGHRGDNEEFLELDIAFHRLVLLGSGNEMFLKLHPLVAEVLSGRHQYRLTPHLPHHEALQLHVDVANAVQRGDGRTARDAMARIMERAMEETTAIWSGSADEAAPRS